LEAGDRTELYWRQSNLSAKKLPTQKGDIYEKDYNLWLLTVSGDWIYNLEVFYCQCFLQTSWHNSNLF